MNTTAHEYTTTGTPIRRQPDPVDPTTVPRVGLQEIRGWTITSLREVTPRQTAYDAIRELVMQFLTHSAYHLTLSIHGDALVLGADIVGVEHQLMEYTPGGPDMRAAKRRAVADGWDLTGCTPSQVREMLAMWVCDRVLGDWDTRRLHQLR